MENNFKRGHYALFWMKATLVIGVLTVLAGAWFWADYGAMLSTLVESANARPEHAHYAGQQFGMQMAGESFGFLLQILLLCFLGFAFGICMFIETLFWSLWLLRTVRNLRVVGSTRFSPWGAVILSWIPYVNAVMHYLVFRDIVQRQESYLLSRGVAFKPVPVKFVKAWFVGLVVADLASFASGSVFVASLLAVATLISFVFYIKTFSQYIAGEESVYASWQDSVVQRKVDQVLREREIEKAVAEIQKAEFACDATASEKPADAADPDKSA